MQNSKHLGTFVLVCLAVACGGEGTGDDDGGGARGTAHAGGAGATAGAGSGAKAGAGTGKAGAAASGGGASGGGAGRSAGGGSGGANGGASGGAGMLASGGTLGSAGSDGSAGMNGGSAGSNATGGASNAGGAPVGGRGGASAGSGGASAGGTAGNAGSGASGGSGKGGSGSCDAPPDPSPLVGWAAVSGGGVTTTTGGGNAAPTVVTTLADFTNAVKGTNAAVIVVKGKLDPGKVSVGSNKTIAGVCGAEIHGHLELSGSTNVIVRNLKIVGYGVGNCSLDPDYDSGTGCSSGNDAITVQKNAHHVWFDHCDVSDGTDGNLDITNGANYVTVSWTKFHYTARSDNDGDDSTGASGHRYSNLIGGTDSPSSYDDANALNVTWHHDWWAERVVERQPRVRFGKNHLFNNLWNASGDNYCVRAGKQARILIEKSVFDGVKDPQQFNNSTDEGTANITAGTDNLYMSTSGTKATGGGGPAFGAVPYAYTADDASGVSAAVQSGAGPE